MYNDRSFYPEKLVFWGAGATANLDMPTTAQLGSAIRKLMENEADACYEMIADELLHFLAIVEVPLEKSHRENPKSLAALHALFPQKTEREHQKVAMRYRQVYDWEALKAIAKLVKGDDLKFMAQLYDLLDGSIVQSSGISVEIDGSGTLLSGELENYWISCRYSPIPRPMPKSWKRSRKSFPPISDLWKTWRN